MQIPAYWAKGCWSGVDRQGKAIRIEAWGWSGESAEAARARGEDRARRAGERLRRGDRGRGADSYDYLAAPLREEVLQEVRAGGEVVAVITRNRYGSMVLNAARVCFVDVDFPAPRAGGLVEAVRQWLVPARRRAQVEAVQSATIGAVRGWAAAHPDRSFRLYRTAAGLRLLFTDRLYDPSSAEVSALLEELGSDPLYQRLTKHQECFRARLTAKPWRCGCERPPQAYPWATPEAEAAARAWEAGYGERAAGFAACRLVESLGAQGSWVDSIAVVVATHDAMACGAEGLALA